MYEYFIACYLYLYENIRSIVFSWSNKCWYLNDVKAIREKLGLRVKTAFEKVDTGQIAEINRPALQRMHETPAGVKPCFMPGQQTGR